MDFDLNDDQVALADGTRAVIEARFDRDQLRSTLDSGELDRDRWNDLAATGVFGLPLTEAQGGIGLGWADAAVVFEQLGRGLVPGPLIGTALAADRVEGALDGGRCVGVIERPEPGEDAVIEHGPWIDDLVILDGDGIWHTDPSTLASVRAEHPLDPLTPIVTTASLPAGERIGEPHEANEWRVKGAVLRSALQLGLATGATELAVEYAMQRQQFGKPIGQFQAIKHLCADMLARVEVARAAVYFAGVALDDNEVAEPARASAVACIVASQAGSQCGKDCVQVHGGMGYTWEVDAHLFLKRSWALDHSFGSQADHAEYMASCL